MKITLEMVILMVSSANTLCIILLIVLYCVQVHKLSQRMYSYCVRQSEFNVFKSPSGTNLLVGGRPRSNSVQTVSRQVFNKQCVEASGTRAKPNIPLPVNSVRNHIQVKSEGADTISEQLVNETSTDDI